MLAALSLRGVAIMADQDQAGRGDERPNAGSSWRYRRDEPSEDDAQGPWPREKLERMNNRFAKALTREKEKSSRR
jgi:hypothetical protein